MKRLLIGVMLVGSLYPQQRTTSAEAYNERGLVHMRENRFVDAIAEFRQAVQAKPDFVRAWNNLGSVLAQAGDMTESVAAFRKAVTLSPVDPQLRMNLGIALRSKGDASEALEEFRSVLKTRSNDPDVHHQLALTLKQAGDLQGAISGFETVLGIHSEHREAYYNLATVLRQQAARTKRHRPDPSAEPQLATTREMLSRGNLKGAVDEIERLSQKLPDSPDVLNLKGFIQGQQRDLNASIATLKRAVELAPGLSDARYNLGVALWYSGDRVNSLKQLDAAAQSRARFPDRIQYLPARACRAAVSSTSRSAANVAVESTSN
jgi:Flp pilus assembly protein TadD